MNILVVDDEPKVAGFLRQGLEEEGHRVAIAHDGEEAISLAGGGAYELVILDVMLPKQDGLAVCRQLREAGSDVYILMLSALGETTDRVAGLRQGADDYLAKPFAFDELLARVVAFERRTQRDRGGPLTAGDLRLDPLRRTVERDGQPIALTNREFELLAYFMHHPGEVLSRDRLAAAVWQMDFDPGTNVVDVYVAYLRKKLEKAGARPIQTVRGEGYRFDPDSRE